MAGHSRNNEDRPAQYAVRQQRRRVRVAQLLAAAGTPSRRVGVVADHLRAALAYVPPAMAEQIASQVIAVLNQAVEQAYVIEAKTSRNERRP
jgi:hypothetical protein